FSPDRPDSTAHTISGQPIKSLYSVLLLPRQAMSQPIEDIFELIRACAAGDAPARRQFQDEYGEDIYYFPVTLQGLPLEKAGDFYVYAFDHDRIFTRLLTFAGRRKIQFRTFLSFFVLKSLFFDWLRTLKEIDTISSETPKTDASGKPRVLGDSLPDPAT